MEDVNEKRRNIRLLNFEFEKKFLIKMFFFIMEKVPFTLVWNQYQG